MELSEFKVTIVVSGFKFSDRIWATDGSGAADILKKRIERKLEGELIEYASDVEEIVGVTDIGSEVTREVFFDDKVIT